LIDWCLTLTLAAFQLYRGVYVYLATSHKWQLQTCNITKNVWGFVQAFMHMKCNFVYVQYIPKERFDLPLLMLK